MKKIIIKKNEGKKLKLLVKNNQDFFITLEENSELNLMTIFNSNESNSKINFNIDLKKNSKLSMINLQKSSINTNNEIKREVIIDRDSNFSLFDLNFGGKLITSNVSVNLNGENSRFEHFGVFVGNKEQKFDIQVNAFHNAKNTYSNMLTKGALSDMSKSFYKGLIKINKNASNSNGYQKQDAILLSENAESNSTPKLEIDNNEVRCTHGSSVSQIDEDKLFYVMSRGLNPKEAKVNLIKGFLQEVTDKVNFGELDKLIGEKIR